MRRDSHTDYQQELQVMGHKEVTFVEETVGGVDPQTFLYAVCGDHKIGYFVKAWEGFWRFHAIAGAMFDAVALRTIARKLIELDEQRPQTEKIHGRERNWTWG